MAKPFYITTAIDYANSTPHLGTAYEKIGADVIARYKRLMGFDVRFLMGNDEHSQNVRKKATELGLAPKVYCDQMAQKFKEVWKILAISNDDFIQTTEPRHHQTVRAVAERIFKKGYIYKAPYEGHYCVSCEAFYQEKDLAGGLCPNHKTQPEWIREENYFFKLTAFEKPLRELMSRPDFLRPEARRNELLHVLEQGLQDVSISRAGTDWGIPLPFDEKAVAYVWFDALINYVSGLGSLEGGTFKRYWPADLHVIGKDITRFHCLIWPAMLIAADLPVPRGVWSHGFISIDGEKMSKSRGNVADPRELSIKFDRGENHHPSSIRGSEILRYYLMREVAWDKDGDFSESRMKAHYESDLGNNLGNFINRVATLGHKSFGQVELALPPTRVSERTQPYIDSIALHIANYIEHMKNFQFSSALSEMCSMVSKGNAFIADEKPWVLRKEQKLDQAVECLFYSLDTARIACLMLLPFMPEKAAKLLSRLTESSNSIILTADNYLNFQEQYQNLRLNFLERLQTRLDFIPFPKLDVEP